MIRGYLYEITDDLDMYPIQINNPDTNDAEYGFLQRSSTKASDIVETMKQYGTKFTTIENPDEPGSKLQTFRITDGVKYSYFKNRLCKLQHLTMNTTIEEFMSDGKAIELTSLIDNTCDDAVLLNGSFYTFDSFMRMTNPSQTYYMGHVWEMHY